MWLDIIALFGWWTLSVFKFLFVPFLYIQAHDNSVKDWLMSILITSTAGSFSAAVFYTLSSFFINRKKSEKTLKVTTTKRRIITIKHRWGLRGMLLIAPFISIPLAAIITAKFFRHIPHALTKLITAIILWSVLLSTLSCGIKFLTQKI